MVKLIYICIKLILVSQLLLGCTESVYKSASREFQRNKLLKNNYQFFESYEGEIKLGFYDYADAIASGNNVALQVVFDKWSLDPNMKGLMGDRLVFYAARHKSMNSMKWLAESGAEFDVYEDGGRGVMHHLLEAYSAEMLLGGKGCDGDQKYPELIYIMNQGVSPEVGVNISPVRLAEILHLCDRLIEILMQYQSPSVTEPGGRPVLDSS